MARPERKIRMRLKREKCDEKRLDHTLRPSHRSGACRKCKADLVVMRNGIHGNGMGLVEFTGKHFRLVEVSGSLF